MLAQIRAFAKSPFASVLLVLVLASFVVLGIRGAGASGGMRDEVIQAGSRAPITSAGFRDRFNFFKQQLEQQNQQPIPLDLAIQNDLDRKVADELAYSEAFAALLTRLGVQPADQLIVDKLRTIPRFFNPITGQFDKAAYNDFLRQNNMTAVQAESELRDEIAERQFVSGMAAGLRGPLVYAAVQAAYLKEGRDFQYFVVAPKILGPPVKPTDAELNAFIKENSAQLMKPEMRQLSVLHVSAAAIASTLAAKEADVQKRFDFEKDTLSSPEKRSFLEFVPHDPTQASALADKVKTGGDPQAIAKGFSAQLIPFTDQPKSAVPDKGVADAAFALKAGETSGPVHGDFATSVVKVLTVTPGHAATLAEARPKIEAEVKKAAAEDKAYQTVQKYEDARSGGADMAAAAKAVGQTPEPVGPVTAKGVTVQGQQANLPAKALAAAFALPQGGDTDPINAGQGEYYVVHVDKVLPPALPSLDEIRPKLTQYFILHAAAVRLQAKAQALADAIAKGQSLQDAARSVDATVMDGQNVLRSAQGQTYSAEFLNRLSQAKTGQVVVGEDVRLGFVVAKLTAIRPPEPAAIAPLIVGARSQVSKSLFDDLGQATRSAARIEIKPHVDYVRARQALGVTAPSQGQSR